jgi:hypothetical protein
MSAFKGRHFEGEMVLWAVRWYCRYGISYRDLEQMMTERGVAVDPGFPTRISYDGGDQTSQVPGGPCCERALLSDPVGPPRSATAALRCCLPPIGSVDSHDKY